MTNENSNTGIYDQFPFIKPSYISFDKIKPSIDERIDKNRQNSKNLFLLFL